MSGEQIAELVIMLVCCGGSGVFWSWGAVLSVVLLDLACTAGIFWLIVAYKHICKRYFTCEHT